MDIPYKIGPSVDGLDFYGRQELITKLLQSNDNLIWLKGNRRVGKSSLLWQLHCKANSGCDYLAFFMDFGGTITLDDWTDCLAMALESEHGQRAIESVGINMNSCKDLNFFELQKLLITCARQHGRKLLLLCDEVEAWVNTIDKYPPLIQKLRRTWTQPNNMLKAIISATGRLDMIIDHDDMLNSSILPQPVYIAQLPLGDADNVIELVQHPEGKVKVSPKLKEKIRSCSGNHPFLIQFLCYKLYQEDGRKLRPLTEEDIIIDKYLDGIFTIDFEGLNDFERKILLEIASGNKCEGSVNDRDLQNLLDIPTDRLHTFTLNLKNLGMINQYSTGYTINNLFLLRWLLANLHTLQVSGRDSIVKGVSPALPEATIINLSQTFLRCSEFENDSRLKALFSSSELFPYQHNLPDTSSQTERVSTCIYFLLPKRTSDGKPVILFFLSALRYRYNPEDELFQELLRLYNEVKEILHA